MRGSQLTLGLCLAALVLPEVATGGETIRLVGDVMLGRLVGERMDAEGRSPWDEWGESRVAAMVGNFEGAVGNSSECIAQRICLAVDKGRLPALAAAGFTRMIVTNNHALDLGPRALERTIGELDAVGVRAIDKERSPDFLLFGERTIAIAAANLITDAAGQKDRIPGYEFARQLRLAASLADWTIAYLHWGAEMRNWQTPEDEARAKWLITSGADVVAGAHPHVPITPHCVADRPVFPSLGNHVFDQRYLETWKGLVADCTAEGGNLSCGAWTTVRDKNSFAPRRNSAADQLPCSVPARERKTYEGVSVSGQRLPDGRLTLSGWAGRRKLWSAPPAKVVSFDRARFERGNSRLVLMVLMQNSRIDGEIAPRPYVYEVRPTGLIPRWRGSALAWPLLDARPMDAGDGSDVLCALHRGDSFLVSNPKSTRRVSMVYRWAGFGFRGDHDRALASRCARTWRDIGEPADPAF